MSFQSVHNANENFKLTMMWLLLGALLLSMVMMFIHPTAALALFFLGMAIVAVSALIEKGFLRFERTEIRKALRTHHCPSCGNIVHHGDESPEIWHCDGCGSNYLDSGEIPYVRETHPAKATP